MLKWIGFWKADIVIVHSHLRTKKLFRIIVATDGGQTKKTDPKNEKAINWSSSRGPDRGGTSLSSGFRLVEHEPQA